MFQACVLVMLVISYMHFHVNQCHALMAFSGFTYQRFQNRMYMSAITSVIKKAKIKEVSSLLKEIESSGDNHIISQFLHSRVLGDLIGPPIGFYNSTVTRFNSLTVMAEYNKKAKTGFILGMPEPEIMGGVLRDAGAKAIAVEIDKRSGNVSYSEFIRFAKEQRRARNLMPGPVPVVWSDFIVDKIQIAQAASHGAAAITLQTDLTENLMDFVNYAKELGIEPIIMVKDRFMAEKALSSGTRSICMHNMAEDEFIELRNQLPQGNSVQYIARLRAETSFSLYSEIDTSWALRDSGFQCVWPSPESIYSMGVSDIYPGILAMKSKASKKFLSPRQFMMDRKKEGAQEYLGSIEM